MNAKEAKRTTNYFLDESLQWVFKNINKAARNGEISIFVPLDNLSIEQSNRLQELNYTVSSDFANYYINWYSA